MRWFLMIFLVISCGQGKGIKVFKGQESDFAKFVNAKELSGKPNLTIDKALINNDYPIEIALYQNGKFYYNLPNLGDGEGTWEFRSKGFLELKAKRDIFDMYIQVRGADEQITTVAVEFSDRFGANVLKMSAENL